jgi:beta-galactosidase
MLEKAGVPYCKLPTGVEKHSRYSDECSYDFYLNFSEDEKTIPKINGTDLLTGKEIDGALHLDKYQVAIIKKSFDN